MNDESFRARPPPIHPDYLGPPPGSILLDRWGYISSRTIATTAECLSRTKTRIQVTFWAAHPPRASWFAVYSPGLEPSLTFVGLPKILNTDDDLVLLRVPICDVRGVPDTSIDDYFVYQAGTENKGPSLGLLAARLCNHIGDQVGLLRCRARDMYFIAILDRTAREQGKYCLRLYSSETETWSTKLMEYLGSLREQLAYLSCGKVITIGGELGSVGWVDHWRGILICDVLLDNRELRYIPLPPPAVPRPSCHADGVGCRDVIVLEGGYIKYFEMSVSPNLSPNRGWEAVEWGRKDSWKEWKKHRVIKVSVDLKEQPTLKAYSGFPALSLHDDGVVYIMDRHSYRDTEALVIAVDMRNQTLKGVADYDLRIPAAYSFYCISGISKHLRRTSSARGNAETSTNETLQAGKEEVPREGVQSQLSKVHGTSPLSK